MTQELHVSFLTGSAKVIKNHIHRDELEWRERRTVGQMFFKPYESTEEFIFCVRHTFIPVAMLRLAILDPLLTITFPAVICGAALTSLALAGLNDLFRNGGRTSDFLLNVAKYLIMDLCQTIIDCVVFPVSALAMITRGIATGLDAVYGNDAPAPAC